MTNIYVGKIYIHFSEMFHFTSFFSQKMAFLLLCLVTTLILLNETWGKVYSNQ